MLPNNNDVSPPSSATNGQETGRAAFSNDGRLRILIAVCTHNRAERLRQTLERLCEIDKPVASEWLVLVVNNRSTDQTDALVAQYTRRLPIHLVQEPQLGIAYARNRAATTALQFKADYILWMDDDVLPCQNLLVLYEQAFVRADGTIIFGGPIDPLFEINPPRWMIENFEPVKSSYGIIDPFGRDVAEPSTDMNVVGLPYGANFALKLDASWPLYFDTRLGIKGDHRMLREESALMEGLQKAGAPGRWIPQARTRHFIPAAKLNLAYIGMYYRRLGRTYALEADQCGGYWKKRDILRQSLASFAQASKQALGARGISQEALRHYVQASIAWGRFFM